MPPPANTPSEQAAPSATSPYLQQLEVISSPVPDYAATLTSHLEDDANDENVSFLRNHIHSSPDQSQGRSRRRRQPYSPEDDWDHMDPTDRRNFRSSAINRRIPIVRRQREEANNIPNYETHSPNAQSLYGWAPLSDNEDDRAPDSQADFLQELWYGRVPNRDPSRAGESARSSRREIINGPPTFTGEMGDGSEGIPSTTFRYGGSSLSTAALLQSVRRHPRFSSRSRTLQNYILDRERSGQEADERERERPAVTSRTHRATNNHRGESYRSHPELQARIDAHRQLYSENPSVKRVKEIIKYLERIRFSRSYEMNLSLAAAGGLIEYDGFNRNEHDFVLDTTSIGPPSECSWLQPGTVFSGSQQAGHTTANPMIAHRMPNSQRINEPVIVNGSETGRLSVYTSSGRRYWASNTSAGRMNRGNEGSSEGGAKEDVWPVRVTIHDIDYENMTLSGTMEAYNIPDKTASSQDAHIVTFLEGELIDFNTHTLETKSFKADAEVDSTYWRELQPFKSLTDDELVKNLVSKQWLSEELAKGWILMRWKERCFITPTDSRQGLTISGFYYISLRRDNGQIDGLYYDPGSSPYQQLSLKPEMKEQMVFPAYGFR